jgi:hypothetical protein
VFKIGRLRSVGSSPATGANFKTNKMANWKTQKHKVGNGQQEIQVKILVTEMQQSWATDSESWSIAFKDKLKEIKRTNSFSAEYGYTATPINETSLEVWKMKTNGDFNYIMFTVTRE